MKSTLKIFLIILLLAGENRFSVAQIAPEKQWNSAKILQQIEKMKHVGRVLYVAAHPDDENTQLISFLSNVLGLETAYLSLTRGDGGQDLLGPEVREELGVIRTQELLRARSIDGGQQFFSRANDFGFSKTASGTLHIWDSNEVLSDMVWVIRKFKPDIIITRFSPTYTKTHGHHQASAILALAAFKDAADPAKFPEQLKYVGVWQAQSLFWNTSPWFYKNGNMDTAGLYHTGNIGVYMPLLGESTGEMAAESRTMHKSQGMGTSPKRGDATEYFVWLEGNKPVDRDIFNSIHSSWNRIKGCESVTADVDNVINSFNPIHPDKSVESLISLHSKLEPFKDNYLVESKLKQMDDIILQCMGVYTEALSNKKFLPLGDSINVNVSFIKESHENPLDVESYLSIEGREVASLSSNDKNNIFFDKQTNRKEIALEYNEPNYLNGGGIVPLNTDVSGPYWLANRHTTGMYKVDDQLLRGLAQNPPKVVVHLFYNITGSKNSLTIEKDIPVFYKYTDPIKGEIFSLARIVPPMVVIPQEHVLVFAGNEPKAIHVKLKSFSRDSVKVALRVPEGWKATPEETAYFKMKGDGDEMPITFTITPPANALTGTNEISVMLESANGINYGYSFQTIAYGHIPEQILLPPSVVKVVTMDIKTRPYLIGYIAGAGDDIPDMLRQIGYKVEMINPEEIDAINLQKYAAIIAGVRAYNTVPQLKYENSRLMNYVKNGGTYIVQYNNNFRLVTDSIGPYYLHLSNIRTTDEDCKVTFLNATNPALNLPNRITANDFDGWVQERGLYYPDKWDTVHYIPLLEMADKGEMPTQGALLVAKYGKGYFVYTGLSFFRELPAGVPGAFRLMANLIELGKN